MLRGRGRGGGEYTVLEVKGYPGDVVQYIGDVPPGLNRKCLEIKHIFSNNWNTESRQEVEIDNYVQTKVWESSSVSYDHNTFCVQ